MRSYSSIVAIFLGVLLVQCAGPGIEISETIEVLEGRVKGDPNDPVNHYNLGLGYVSKRKFSTAQACFDSALAINPGFAEAHFANYCVKYALNKKMYEALREDDLKKDTSQLVKSVDRHLQKATLYNPFFDWRVSTILLESPPVSNDRSIQEFINLFYEYFFNGFREFSLGNYSAAIQKLTNTIELVPDWTQCYLVRGYAYAQMGQYNSAIEDFQHVIDEMSQYNTKRILPVYINTAELKYLVAYAYERDKNIIAAEKEYQKVLLEDLSFYMAHVRLGRIFLAKKMTDQALQEFEAALLLEPNDAVIRYEHARTLVSMQRYDEALKDYENIISNFPKNSIAYYYSGILLNQLGKKGEALVFFQKFMEVSPTKNVEELANAKAILSANR